MKKSANNHSSSWGSRRRFLQTAGALAAGTAALSVPVGVARASDDDSHEVGFRFVVQSRDGETGQRINLEGAGAFNDRHVEGDGTFTWFDPAGQPPFPIIAAGSWRARRFLGFTPTDPPVYGVQGAGILDVEVELRPISGRR